MYFHVSGEHATTSCGARAVLIISYQRGTEGVKSASAIKGRLRHIGYRFPLSFLYKGGREENPTHPPSLPAWQPGRRTKQQARHLSHFGHCQEDASQERTAEGEREGGEVEYITVYAEPKLQDVLPLCLSSELDVSVFEAASLVMIKFLGQLEYYTRL